MLLGAFAPDAVFAGSLAPELTMDHCLRPFTSPQPAYLRQPPVFSTSYLHPYHVARVNDIDLLIFLLSVFLAKIEGPKQFLVHG